MHVTRRTLLGGAVAAGAASVLAPAESLAAALEPPPGVFSSWVGSLHGTSGVIAAPARFELVGAQWAGPAHARIELRTRGVGGRWSRWALASVCGHGPDRAPAGGLSVRRADLERARGGGPASKRRRRRRRAPALRHRPRCRRCDGGCRIAARRHRTRRRSWPAADHRPRRMGTGRRAAAIPACVRLGEARLRPPQRGTQRLSGRRRPGDPEVDLPVPPVRARLQRHRLQLRDRRLRADLGGTGGWRRRARDRRACRWLQLRVDRRRDPRDVHQRAAAGGGARRARASARVEAVTARRPGPRSRRGTGRPGRRRVHTVCPERARVAAEGGRPPRRRSDRLPRQRAVRATPVDPPARRTACRHAGEADGDRRAAGADARCGR